jgi:hypothetical protein
MYVSMSSGLAVATAVLTLTGCDRPGVSSGAVTLNTSAGTVTVECIDQEFVKVDGAQPAAGYTAKIVVPGPSNQASVNFESPSATDIRAAIRCVDGQATVEEFNDEDHPIPPENRS